MFIHLFLYTLQSTVASNRGLKATEMILKHLESIDKVEDKKAEVKEEENFDDLTLFDISKEDEEEGNTTANTTSVDDSLFNDDFGKL